MTSPDIVITKWQMPGWFDDDCRRWTGAREAENLLLAAERVYALHGHADADTSLAELKTAIEIAKGETK